MTDRGPFSRVFWSIRTDERLANIYPHDARLGAWLRLLMAADMAWPGPADIPATANRKTLASLCDEGVIELLPGGMFRFHGLDSLRNERSEKARQSVRHRYDDGSTTGLRPKYDRTTTVARSKIDRTTSTDTDTESETERERNSAREGLPHLNSAVERVWEEATGRSILGSGAFASEYLDDACRRHPPSEVAAAIIRARKAFDAIPATQALTVAVRGLLDPLPDGKAVRSVEDTAKRAEATKRQMQLTKHSGGYHIDAPDPDCPKCQKGAA
jgi:hypothetical protein